MASTQFASDVWMLPVDAARGKVTGEIKRLTEDPAEDDSVAISADGVRLVFNSKRDGRTGLWLRDMNTGKLRKLSPGATHFQWPQITADGRFAGFGKLPTKATPPFGYGIVGVDDGSLREVDTPSSVGPWGLSPLGDYIVAAGASDGPLQATRLETGENKVFLEHKEWQLLSPHFSPDERWIALHTRPSETARQLFIVVRDPDVPGRT